MNTRQKLLWSIPYAVLIVGFALAGQRAVSSDGTPAAPAHRLDHSMVDWDALPLSPDPSPLSVAAYDS